MKKSFRNKQRQAGQRPLSRRANSKADYNELEPRRLLAPVVSDDFYSSVGNTTLEVSASADFNESPSVKVTGSLFDNDDAGVTLDSFDAVSINGAQVSVLADGSFVYSAAVGVTDLTDTFSYTVSDGTETSTGTVHIELSGTVWYIDQSADPGGDGTSDQPFDTLANVNGEGGEADVDAPGGTIYLLAGTFPYESSLELEDGQRLIGEGVALVVDGHELNDAGDTPTLTEVGNIITLAADNTIAGVNVQVQTVGIVGSDVGTLTFDQISVFGGLEGVVVESTEAIDLTITNSRFSDSETRGVLVSASDFSSVITDNVFQNSERGFDGKLTGVGNHQVLRNHFESISDNAYSLGDSNQEANFDFDISENTFYEMGGSSVGVFTGQNVGGDAKIWDNVVTQSGYQAYYAISVVGGFRFNSTSLLRNDLDNLFGFQFTYSVFDDVHLGDWTIDYGLYFRWIEGAISFDRLELKPDSERANTAALVVDGISEFSVGHLEVDSTSDHGGFRNGYQENYLGYSVASVYFRGISDLTVGSGNLRANSNGMVIDRVNVSEFNWGEFSIDSTSDAFGIGLVVRNTEGQPLNFEGESIRVVQDESMPETRGYEIDIANANVVFNTDITIQGYNYGETNSWEYPRGGIHVEGPSAMTPDVVLNEVIFNGSVDVYAFNASGIDLAGGKVVFNGPIDVSAENISGDFQSSFRAYSRDAIYTRLEIHGGINAYASGDQIRPISLVYAVATITGDQNFISTDGTRAGYFGGVIPVGEGIHISEIDAPDGVLEFILFDGSYRFEEDELADFYVDGAINVQNVRIESHYSDIIFSSPESKVINRGSRYRQPESSIAFWVGILRSGANVRYNGTIESHIGSAVTVVEPRPTYTYGVAEPTSVTFGGAIRDYGGKGIELVAGIDGVENLPFKTVTFEAPVMLGSEDSPVSSGLSVSGKIRAVFEDDLAIFTDNSNFAIQVTEEGGFKPQLIMDDVVAHSNFGALFVEGADFVKSNSGVLTSESESEPSGQTVVVRDADINLNLNRVVAGAGEGAAIDVQNSTGTLKLLSAEGEAASQITGRTDAAIGIEGLTGVVLENVQIEGAVNDGIRLNDVHSFRLERSSIVETGSSRKDHGLEVENGTGYYRILDSVIEDTFGFHDVSVTNRKKTELDSLIVKNSKFGGNSHAGGKSILVSAYAQSKVFVSVTDSIFTDNNGDQMLFRTNGFASGEFRVGNNIVRHFVRGIGFQQRGSSELAFDVYQNQIVGKADDSSQFGVYASGLANSFGSGSITGQIRNHNGTFGDGTDAFIARTDGIRIDLKGHEMEEGPGIGTTGDVSVSNNIIRGYDGFAAIHASVDGNDSDLTFVAIDNYLTGPKPANAFGIRFTAGVSSPSQSVQGRVTIKNNNSIAGQRIRSAGYQMVQRNDATLELTAPAGNPAIGSQFNNSDGGVIMSVGATGNNNVNRQGTDVIAVGQIDIVEED